MKKLRLHKSLIVSALAVLAVILLTAAFGDYFFDLNDDVLMKDILSGAYTGTPEGHNIQMLYPVSLFIACLYKTGINADWYGIFLCFFQYLCMFIIGKKIYDYADDFKKGILYVGAFVTVVLGFFWPHLLYVQYTVVCSLLSATAALLILTSKKETKRDNILALALIFIAYLIRSEMLLLTLPMVGVAILIKWCITRMQYCKSTGMCMHGEKKRLFRRYIVLCVTIVCGLAVCHGAHTMGYISPQWKEFNRFFDNRTELYDFQYIPDYEENKAFYDSIDLSESEQQLFINYNFELDDEINADTVGAIAEYAASIRGEETPFAQRLKSAVSLYIYRLHHVEAPRSYEYPMTDYPWNVGVIILYITVFAACIIVYRNEKSLFVQSMALLVTLFACRTVLWLYIIMRGRDPIRITHPMYFLEMLILLGMLMLVVKDRQKKMWIPALLLAIVGCISIPMQLNVINKENVSRQAMLEKYGELYDYFDANKDSYFLVDVYTSVSCGEAVPEGVATFSEKMFEGVDNSFYNHDILGGWASKSPAYKEKLNRAGFDNAQDALLASNVYFVQNKMGDVSWLENYYREKGVEIKIVQKEIIADVFAIYQLESVD